MFHPSYRVKHIKERQLTELVNTDIFLDIVQCESDGLIKVTIKRNENQQQNFKTFLEDLYMPQSTDGN